MRRSGLGAFQLFLDARHDDGRCLVAGNGDAPGHQNRTFFTLGELHALALTTSTPA